MNIGFLVETPITEKKKMYGAQRSFVMLLKELKLMGVNSFVVVSEEWEIVSELRKIGAEVLITPIYEFFTSLDGAYGEYHDNATQKRQNMESLDKIRKYFTENHVQLVHMNTRFCGLLGAEIAVELGIPYIFHIREFLEADFGLTFKDQPYADKMIGNADALIAISNAIHKYLRQKYPSTRIDTIYNGISAEKYSNGKCIKFQNTRIRLVIAGRVISHKGQFDAIRAVEKVFKELGSPIELFVVGIMPNEMTDYEKMIVNYVQDNCLEDVVKFIPFTDNIEEIYRICDIGLMCSKKEAFGRVTVEYMLSNLLVIGANSGGTPELITDRETGLLYEEGNYEALASIIQWAILHKDESRKCISKGYTEAITRFSAKANAEHVYNIYLDLLR